MAATVAGRLLLFVIVSLVRELVAHVLGKVLSAAIRRAQGARA